MLHGAILACIMIHGEVFAYMLYSCFTELALGPFGPQSSPSSPEALASSSNSIVFSMMFMAWSVLRNVGVILEVVRDLSEGALKHRDSSGKPLEGSWKLLGSILEPWSAKGSFQRPLGRSWRLLGPLLEVSWCPNGSHLGSRFWFTFRDACALLAPWGRPLWDSFQGYRSTWDDFMPEGATCKTY